jgi:hypothetical protein
MTDESQEQPAWRRAVDWRTLERIDMTDDEQIVAVCARDKSRQRIPIADLPLLDPLPKGSEWIDAYRRWARHGR